MNDSWCLLYRKYPMSVATITRYDKVHIDDAKKSHAFESALAGLITQVSDAGLDTVGGEHDTAHLGSLTVKEVLMSIKSLGLRCSVMTFFQTQDTVYLGKELMKPGQFNSAFTNMKEGDSVVCLLMERRH